MKLTSLKVLIETYTPEDIKILQNYEKELIEAEKLGLKEPEEPEFKKPEYKTKYYNFDQYILDTWFAHWDKERNCPVIIATWFHVPSSSLSLMNVQMKESEWIEFLGTIGYSCK